MYISSEIWYKYIIKNKLSNHENILLTKFKKYLRYKDSFSLHLSRLIMVNTVIRNLSSNQKKGLTFKNRKKSSRLNFLDDETKYFKKRDVCLS